MSVEGFTPRPVLALGGLCDYLERSEVPMGMSPNCADIEFRPKAILSRPGLGLRFTDGSPFTGIKSFYGQDRVRRLMTLQASGKLSIESPEGQVSQVYHAFTKDALMKATYAFGRLWLCLSDGKRPLDFPMVYDPIAAGNIPYLFGPATLSPPANSGTAARNAGGGLIDAGIHYFFYTFEDKYGFVTQQSPVNNWTSNGSDMVDFSNIATGPTGLFGATVRRRIWVSPAYVAGAGVAGFFNNGALTIENNTATTLSGVSLTDATLQEGWMWETENLTLTAMPPAIGVTKFADRLVLWGVYPGAPAGLAERVDGDQVLLGRGPEDFTTLTDWTVDFGTVALQTQPSQYESYGTRSGNVLRMTAAANIHKDVANTLTSAVGENQYWLKPGERYGFHARLSGTTAPVTATVSISALPSATAIAWRQISLPSVASGFDWNVYTVTATADVPLGTTGIRIAVQSSAAGMAVDWIRPFLYSTEFDGSTAWIGDKLIPQNFDLVKSRLPVAPGDWQELRCCFEQNGNLYFVKEHSTWVSADNGQDPNTWTIDNVSFEMGTPSIHGVGLGPDFAIIAGREGVYRFDSGGILPISQEIDTTWRRVDWLNGHRLWVTVDVTRKQIRIGVPLKGAGRTPGVCHVILKCDYSEGWGEGWKDGEGASRKWTPEYVETTCAEMAEKDDGSRNALFGGSRTSSNNLTDTSMNLTSPPWTQVGTSGAGTTALQMQPTGPDAAAGIGAVATKWEFPYSAGATARYRATASEQVALNGHYVASFWAKSVSPATIPATIRSPFSTGDVSIEITSAWQRFVAVFGPAPAAGTAQSLDIDFGTMTAAISLIVFGAQLQSGQYDKGWAGRNGGANLTGTGLTSGFLSEPIIYDPGSDPPWKTSDWDSIITSIYEFAPFGQELGRSNFNRLIARIRGAGNLQAYYVLPDGTTKTLNAGTFPKLSTNPRNDVEMGGSTSDTYVGVRLVLSGLSSWFALKRIGLFSKPHEGAPYRSKS